MSAARTRGRAKAKARKPVAAKRVAPRRTARKTAAPADGLYPRLRTNRTGRLRVSPVHELYFEESGNAAGKPVVFLHGGPGGGTNPEMRRFFDPKRYRIVLFDQRGCGRSTPHASLQDNTTWDLVGDIERLREHLGIERWQVFGGSWGSTLALAYAQKHPDRVTELVLRGIFLLRRSELEWFYQSSEGAASLFPDLWEQYIAPIPEDERYDMMGAYYRRLTSSDVSERNAAARAWSIWEGATSHLRMDPGYVAKFKDADYAAAFARIECHYFVNGGFLDADDQLLRDVTKIRHIPATIVQGRYDVVCPMRSAWHLHRAWPEAELVVVPDAGHSAFEPGIARALRKAADGYSRGGRGK
ncbi:MAG: prolyl aminopeptidase [Gammaproteobacteria bacterium]|nr:prolyl aminopeptidase [Gammaproteobacteria bacterium]